MVLPEVEAVVAVRNGTAASFPMVYHDLVRWADAHGYQTSGPGREVCVSPPGWRLVQQPGSPRGTPAMHPTIMQALVSQHTAEMRAAAARRHQAAAQPGEPALSIRQRVGWVLVQAGLRLAVRQARA